MTILVTGGSGLIGAHVVRALREAGREVITLDRRPLSGESSSIACDLEAPLDVSRWPSRVDAIVHLAQGAGHRDFPASAPRLFAVNTRATAELLEAGRARGMSRFTYASSGSVYAPSEELARESEPLPLEQETFYGTTKRAAELVALGYRNHLTVQVLRLFAVYGAGQREEMLMPRLVRALRERRAITVAGPDGPRMAPTHASDAARVIVASLEQPESAVTNVGGPEVLTLREVVNTLAHSLDVTPVIETSAGPARSFVPDLRAMTARFGPARVRLRDAAREMIA